MRIKEKTVEEVVAEASVKMSDPNYSAVMVGGFVQTQGQAAQYISAHADELGGTENVVHTIFHAALIALCFQRGNNRTVREIEFDELNRVSEGDKLQKLEERQPAIHGYITMNVEDKRQQGVLALLALAMDLVS